MSAPRTSACQPWINGDDVAGLITVQQAINHALALPDINFTNDDALALCAEAADKATTILYERSGRIYTGFCGPVTIRPAARPTNADTLGWITRGWSYGGWGSASMMTLGLPGVVARYGQNQAPVITINNFPVRTIELVKIDGVVIPPNEYELRANQDLIRLLPTPSYNPTQRYGWPTSQRQDLPDTEQGTFSVTYTWGQDCGQLGRDAATALAEQLILPKLGVTTRFPTRTTAVNRQGVTAQVANVEDLLIKGMTGIFEVDLFLKTMNPNGLRRQAKVWSPDLEPNRRQPGVTLS